MVMSPKISATVNVQLDSLSLSPAYYNINNIAPKYSFYFLSTAFRAVCVSSGSVFLIGLCLLWPLFVLVPECLLLFVLVPV